MTRITKWIHEQKFFAQLERLDELPLSDNESTAYMSTIKKMKLLEADHAILDRPFDSQSQLIRALLEYRKAGGRVHPNQSYATRAPSAWRRLFRILFARKD